MSTVEKPSHPPALFVFFGTEMWERYGFYVVQALLAIYLTQHFKLSDDLTYTIVGTFTALTYISPIVGGWIADHLIGQKQAVSLGALVLLMSYILLSVGDTPNALLHALAGVAVGTGLLKPNISSLLGRQYSDDSARRDSGFTIFYMGITSGIILGTTLPSKLQQWYGWDLCFSSAALGLLFALFIFNLGTRYFHIENYARLEGNRYFNWFKAILIALILWRVSIHVMQSASLAFDFFLLIVILAVSYVINVARKEDLEQRKKTLALLLLCVISALFWSFYFQMFMVLTLFITRAVQPTVLGISFPAPFYVTVESVGMIGFGFILTKVWARLPIHNVAISTVTKFMISMLLMLLAYSVILMTMRVSDPGLISPWPIIGAYLIISLAELMLSPIGLSAVTRLASPNVVSTLMGVFFVSLGIGGYLSGKLASLAAIDKTTLDIVQIKSDYFHAFSLMSGLLLLACVLTALIALMIRWMMKRVT